MTQPRVPPLRPAPRPVTVQGTMKPLSLSTGDTSLGPEVSLVASIFRLRAGAGAVSLGAFPLPILYGGGRGVSKRQRRQQAVARWRRHLVRQQEWRQDRVRRQRARPACTCARTAVGPGFGRRFELVYASRRTKAEDQSA